MSLLRTLRPLRSANNFLRPSVSTFHTSSIREAMSEADVHEETEKRDAKIDHHKSDSVSKAKSGKGEWKPELASSGEQAVRADKHDMSMEDMQKKGADKAGEGKQPSGSSSNTGG